MPSSQLAFTDSLPVIRAMPLFAGVDSVVLTEILGHARLVKFDKGKVCLRQGEEVSRLYLILEGWVKIVKSTQDGRELVLNLLGQGDVLMEMAVAGNTRCFATVQAASKVRLLSLPVSVLREYMDKNHGVAVKMMLAAAAQTQNLIGQLEQLMLRDAPQRVGWFLLRFHLLAGRKSAKISLPFDKAVIAAYLGIKPATFSRTLQTFRAKGFVIRNRTVVIPASHALCEFCTPELAQNCSRVGTMECPYPGLKA